MRGEAVIRQKSIDNIMAAKAMPIGSVMLPPAPELTQELAEDSGNDNNNATPHDAVQENLFTTGSGKTVGAQRESNQIAQLSPELVQAGTNMGKIEFERKEAEERKLEAVRDMIEAQQEAYWADREVEFGDISMTGAEWKQTAALMRTDSFKRTMRAKGKAAGYTDAQMDEAEKLAPEIADQLAKGKKPTPEQEAAMQKNPAIWAYVKEGSQQVAAIKQQNELVSSQVSAGTTAAKVGDAAVFAGSDALDDVAVSRPKAASADVELPSEAVDTGLTASVTPLKPTYNAAATASAPAATPAAAKPSTQIAANSSAELQGMGIGV